MYSTVAVTEVGIGGFEVGRWRIRDLREPTQAFKVRLVCTVLLYICVGGDPTLRSNYTITTGSLIKLSATRIIQLRDLQTMLTARRTAQILSNHYCNDVLLIGDVVMSTAPVWPLTSITSKAFQLFPDITHCLLKDILYTAMFMNDIFESFDS